MNKIHSKLTEFQAHRKHKTLPAREMGSASLKGRGFFSYEKLRIEASYLGSLGLGLAYCMLKDGQWEEVNAK